MLRQQTVLAKFGELALRSDNLDDVLTEACRLVGDGLGTDLAKVMQLQEDGRSLLVRAGVGWKPGIVGELTVRAGDDTSEGVALKSGRPMISPDIATETRFEYPPFLVDHGVKAVANVVIIGGQDQPPFGILQIDSREPRQFTEADTTFLSGYANLIAAAVDRLRVIGETRAGEQRLRLALEAGQLGSWELDLASGVANATPRHMEIFGYPDPPPSWTYETFLLHVLPEDRQTVDRGFHEAVEQATEWNFECRIRRADNGEVRWIEARSRPGGSRGNAGPTTLLGIIGDITARKAIEEAQQRANEALEEQVALRTRELVEANAELRTKAAEREEVEEALRQSNKMEAVGQLTGGLAHDFNNMLTGISGSLELIRKRVSEGRSGDLGHYIDAALSSSNRAAALTARLLAFSRRQALDPRPTDVNRLIGGMEDMFSRTVGPSIRVETKLAARLWLPLCDPHQLESALLNLVINARDAMPNGGTLVIETVNSGLPDRHGASRDVAPRGLPHGDYVAVFVTDSGTGMSPEVMAHAFEPFFTTKPLGQGTGLGLSMAYGFVRQSGGQVHLRSEPGQGTTVAIYLPRQEGAEEVETDVAASPSASGPMVLVVEDDPAVRMFVVDALGDSGYTVLEADDGPSGLGITDSQVRLDLLVTDFGLPGGMNGRQLANAARQRRPGLKVLYITGYASGARLTNSALDEGVQLMTKPFRMEALVSRVGEMIGL